MMTKRYINTAFAYGVAGLLMGAFYREFTKFVGYTGPTTLSVVHTHLLALGMSFFLVVACLEKLFLFSGPKRAPMFYIMYNCGLILTVLMFFMRGVLTALSFNFTTATNAAISGLSGIGHIMLTVGMVLFFINLKKSLPGKALSQ